jgi:hypothetical protein
MQEGASFEKIAKPKSVMVHLKLSKVTVDSTIRIYKELGPERTRVH